MNAFFMLSNLKNLRLLALWGASHSTDNCSAIFRLPACLAHLSCLQIISILQAKVASFQNLAIMGCICSKICSLGNDKEDIEKAKDLSKAFATPPALSRKEEVVVKVGVGRIDGSVGKGYRPVVHAEGGSVPLPSGDIANSKTKVVQATGSIHEKQVKDVPGFKLGSLHLSRVASLPNGAVGEQIVAGWPSWLSSVAGEAIKGWVPRRAESFEKLDKIGQGTYSSVYRARDLETGKIVAMKKVRFVNMDPESVRFMAREIYILRRLDHPNVMKLEGLVTSRLSGSLYLVFEYMEHDLAGLAAAHGTKFTEAQVKCYIQQLLRGLEHCHNRGVLHRDIKGSNLLLDNNGNLKIGDFGLATQFEPDQSQPLTSRVVTLWYRAPELLLGSTEYGVGVDLWSTGCILAELFSRKPIMPGRTEVEQMHKIFKLCGSPSEEYWRKSKLPHATSFKPQHSYKRILRETFKEFPPSALSLVENLLSIEPDRRGTSTSSLQSEFFTSKPFPCDPSNLPKYPPSKEFDAKLQNEARRKRVETVRGRGPESVRRGSRDVKNISTPESDSQKQGHFNINSKNTQWHAAGFAADQPKGTLRSGLSHCTSMVHPTADTSWAKKAKGEGHAAPMRVSHPEPRSQKSQVPQGVAVSSRSSQKNDELISAKEFTKGYVPKNRIHYSGPLMPPGGNIEDMLREHEKQIQQAVRKARLNKNKTKKNYENDPQLDFLFPCKNVL